MKFYRSESYSSSPSFVFLSLFLIIAPLYLAACYSYATIDVPGATSTVFSGINDAGQIVGFFIDGGGNHHGFLRDTNGNFTTIDFPGASTHLQGINNAGQIVGLFFPTPSAPFGGTFFRDTSGNFTTISVPGSFENQAHGINNVGEIVGEFQIREECCIHGYLRDSNGRFTRFDVPESLGSRTIADGVNDARQIVGFFYGDPGPDNGFLRDTNGNFTAILSQEKWSFAFGINNAGQIVGFFFDGTRNHGFLRNTNGHLTTIDVPGAGDSEAYGINNGGQIVGSFMDAQGLLHGFIATP